MENVDFYYSSSPMFSWFIMSFSNIHIDGLSFLIALLMFCTLKLVLLSSDGFS